MKTIWKYSLSVDQADGSFSIPKDGKIIYVSSQTTRMINFWVELESNNQIELRHFIVIGTGHSIPDNSEYVGSIMSGAFVWHLYERK